MSFWEIVLDNDKENLGKYNQEYFTEQKIGEIIKKLYEQEIKQGHNLTIRLSKKNKLDFLNSSNNDYCCFDNFFGISTIMCTKRSPRLLEF